MYHALVVGGGLIGLLSARELRLRGFAVTLVERGEIGREASWAGGGILSPLYPWRMPDAITALARRSLALWPGLVHTLHARSGIDPQLRATGMLALADDAPEAVLAWGRRHGVEIRALDPAGVAAREPALALVGGLAARDAPAGPPPRWFELPQIAQVRNPRLLRALLAVVVGEGVEVRRHTPVTALLQEGGRVCGVDTPGGRLSGDAVVLCAGPWTAPLLAGLGVAAPPIGPVRGQMILFESDRQRLRRIVLARNRYLIPRADGCILAGSTIEHAGFERATTAQARAELAAFATGLMPNLAVAPITAHWSGLRPGSPDGVPLIGAHPAVRGLWVNAGHFRNGIATAPASAELVATILEGETPAVDPAPCAWPDVA